jgi:hypothetical protein
MPRTSINYSKSIIYKLCCKDPEIKDIYIGSTTNFRKRKCGHKAVCNNVNSKKFNIKVYKFIRDNGNWENWDMVMIEEYKECQSKLQLQKKERYYIETLCATLNMVIPTQTIDEYNDKNKELIKIRHKIHREKYKEEYKEKGKIYYENNKEIICMKAKLNRAKRIEYEKQYRIDNKEKILKIYKCDCGGTYQQSHKSRHMKTKKHIKYQETHT